MHDDIFVPELLQGIEEGAYCVDRSRRIVAWNGAAERITGYTAAEAVGNRCWHNLLRHVDDQGRQLCRGWCPLVATMQDGLPREARVYLHHHDGHRLPVHVHARPLRAESGEIIGAVETFTPVAGHVGADDRQEVCPCERLSGAPGLSPLAERIAGWLAALGQDGHTFGVVRLRINAREPAGRAFDEATVTAIIKAVRATLGHAIRAGDVAARVDDEEFLILLPDCNEQALGEQSLRLRFLVEQTFLVRNRRLVRVQVQLGAALAQPADSVASLLARAACGTP